MRRPDITLCQALAFVVLVLTLAVTKGWSAEQKDSLSVGPTRWVFVYPSQTPSSEGDFAEVRRTYTVSPANRYILRLTCGDNYVESTSGYHFKQVLVDGEVVWEQDAAGGELEPQSIQVDATKQVKGKSSVTVTLRVIDKQGVANFSLVVVWGEVEAEGLRPAEGSAWKADTRGAWRTSTQRGPVQSPVDLYAAPTGPGKGVSLTLAFSSPARAAKTLEVKTAVKGPWTTFALPSPFKDPRVVHAIRAPCAARDGSIWWGLDDGVVRYDGRTWTKYSSGDGLMDGAVLSIVQGEDGTLYFAGSHKGKVAVTRYDGKVWQTYADSGTNGLIGSYVGGASAIDRAGNLWLTTEHTGDRDGNGVICFDGKTWRNFRVEDGLKHNRVYDVTPKPDGSVWFATFQGVSRFDGKNWTTHTPQSYSARFHQILIARDGKIWCTQGSQGGVSVFDGRAWKSYDERDGMPVKVRAVYQAEDGAIWFGTHLDDLKASAASGLLRYQDGAWLRILKEDGLPGDNVHSIAQARDGSLYLTVPDVGIVRYRPDLTGLGIISGTVKKPDGSSWVGVGISVVDTARQVRAGAATDAEGRYRMRAFPGAYQVSVIQGRDVHPAKVIVEAGKEISRIDFTPTRIEPGKHVPAGPGKTVKAGPGKTVKAGLGFWQGVWQTLSSSDGLVSAHISDILQDKEGNLWFAGVFGGGVSRYDGKSFTNFTMEDGLASNEVWCALADREGNLWFGTEGGVSRYDGKSFTNFTTQDGLVHHSVQSILQDREGSFWFGTGAYQRGGGGVSRYDGKSFTNFTTQDGLAGNWVRSILQDRNGKLWFATDGGVSRYDPVAISGQTGKSFTNFTTQDGLAGNRVSSILEDQIGHLWFGTGGGASRYDGKTFVNLTPKEGMAEGFVWSICQDRQGNFWFGTWGGGVSRYDGKAFTNFTTKEGLGHFEVWRVMADREGNIWFGTDGGGASRYQGEYFTTYTQKDGLVSDWLIAVLADREGHIWVGSQGDGVGRYDGKTWTTFTTKDGLAGNALWWNSSIFQDREGNLWFGTSGGVSRYNRHGFTTFTTKDGLADNGANSVIQDREGNLWFGTSKGVSKYDGKTFTTFTTKDGLADNGANSVIQDREGNLWFGTSKGVSKYDGKTFTTFTTKDGLVSDNITKVLEDGRGNLWFGTWSGGVSRYDGKTFITFTAKDGLPQNNTNPMLQDREGHLWFGSFGGGIYRFDGLVFQNLLKRDGLVADAVLDICQDRKGDIWIATEGGLTRYRPTRTPPPVRLTDVVADRRYGPVKEIRLPSSRKFIVFEFFGTSFKTRPDQMVYVYRLEGYDKEWQKTKEGRVEYTNLPVGKYVFQVKAVDRDLTYSENPAEVLVTIHLPYGTLALAGGLGLALAVAAVASGYAIKRRRDLRRAERALMQEMAKELETAHEMQMALMPKESPRIEGFDIAGRCIPANHVGGDYFQYFSQDDRLTLSLADVTGHAMEAAIPVVMFSGLLKSHMELSGTLLERFDRLNRSLYGTLTGRTLVCLAMGELDLSTHTLSLSDGGCPYPYHYRAATGEVAELQTDAYPLGVRPDTSYQGVEVRLGAGDRVVFCSDGVTDAVNASGEQFGYERTAGAIRGACEEGLSAEGTIDRILGLVNAFRGVAPQADDMTCVALRVKSDTVGL